MSEAPIAVFTASISHRHGTNFYVARTQKGLDKKVADYCREWWAEQVGEEPVPETDSEVTERYFGVANNNGTEFLDLGEDTI